MNRKELVTEIAQRTDTAMHQINATLDHVVDVITEALANGREVALKGFGTFGVSKRAARVGRNPQTGDKIKIKASKAPKFRPSSQLKDAVKTGKAAAKKATGAKKTAAKKTATKASAAKTKAPAKKAPAKKAPAKKAAPRKRG